jgi:uncharacterized protein YceH (UPF0502 family)
MMHKEFGKQLDDILDVVYEAAEVPNIKRRYLTRQFSNMLEKQVDQSIIDYMLSADDPTEDISDLQRRLEEIEKEFSQMKQALKRNQE